MSKVPDRVKMVLAIYFAITIFLVAIVRQIFDTGLADRLTVQTGPFTDMGLPDLFVVLCAIIGGVRSYYGVRRLRRNRNEEGVFLTSTLTTGLLCMAMVGPILDRGYVTHAILCVVAAFIGSLVSLNINIRLLEREELHNAKYNAKF